MRHKYFRMKTCCMENMKGKEFGYWKFIWPCAMLSIGGIIAFLWCRLNELTIRLKCETELLGQYGDYIGGVVGTFIAAVSLIYMYKTFDQQRKATNRASETARNQQLNDKFFHLVENYNKILNQVNYQDIEDEYFAGKIALHRKYQDCFDGYNENIPVGIARKNAVLAFAEFMALERDTIPVYFRTLYRLFDTIYNSDADDRTKVEYAKILRAQLTDTELVLLRYDAMTPAGAKFRFYINYYNLLKHLPPLEMLEFKRWRRMCGEAQNAMRINEVLLTIKKEISYLLDGDKEESCIKSMQQKYIVKLVVTSNMSRISLNFYRNDMKQIYATDPFIGFDRMGIKDICDMLSYYFRECFILSNFNRYNARRELNLIGNHGNNACDILIENKLGNKLVIKKKVGD